MLCGFAKFPGGLALCAACAVRTGALWAGGAETDLASACSRTAPIAPSAYRDHIDAMDRKLGVPDNYARLHALSPVPEARSLVIAGYDVRGRPVKLEPHAAVALQEMLVAAESEGVTLQIVSGYRSTEYQAGLLRDKLHRGMKLEGALRINVPPGYSEHESGCAVDLTAPRSRAADAGFARTRAYAWLTQHAGEYGFHLSYPPDNPHGIEFEPWHWRYVAGASNCNPPAVAPAKAGTR